MSFWNKNKLPAEYKELTEDQIAELLAKGKAAETDAATQKTAAETALAAKTKLETDLAEERKKSAKLAETIAAAGEGGGGGNNGGNNGGNQNANLTPSEADWLTNPNGAFDNKVTPVATIALHGAILAARLTADQYISRQGPVELRLWNKYLPDVEKAVNGLPPDQRIMPNTWIQQFTYIKGLHLNDVVKEAQNAGDAFFSETAGSTGAGLNTNNSGADKDTLTPAEEAIAKKMGRTPEQYLAAKKKMQFGPAPA